MVSNCALTEPCTLQMSDIAEKLSVTDTIAQRRQRWSPQSCNYHARRQQRSSRTIMHLRAQAPVGLMLVTLNHAPLRAPGRQRSPGSQFPVASTSGHANLNFALYELMEPVNFQKIGLLERVPMGSLGNSAA